MGKVAFITIFITSVCFRRNNIYFINCVDKTTQKVNIADQPYLRTRLQHTRHSTQFTSNGSARFVHRHQQHPSPPALTIHAVYPGY